MMSAKLQIILVVCLVCAILYITNLLTKKRMDFRHALEWFLVIVCILVVAIFPQLLNWLSEVFGIASPMNMLFFLGFCFSVFIIFALSVAVGKLTEKVKRLSQEIAIIRKDMHDKIEEVKKDNEEV